MLLGINFLIRNITSHGNTESHDAYIKIIKSTYTKFSFDIGDDGQNITHW